MVYPRLLRRSHGFTLLEILVTMSILLIITAVSMKGIAQYAHRQTYQTAVERIRSDFMETREKTLASYNDTVYGMYVGTTTIEFFKGATPVVGSSSNTFIDLSKYGVTATPSFKNGIRYIKFARLTGAASATGTLKISDTHSSASTTLTIFTSGLIQ